MKWSTYENVKGIIGVLVQTSSSFNQNVTYEQELKQLC